MRLQLTGLLRRIRPWHRLALPDRADPGTDVPSDVCAAARDRLPTGYRARYDGLFDAARPDAVVRSAVLERALAATGSVLAAEAMAQAWERLSKEERRCVHDPVRAMALDGRQSDATTCGSAVVTMVAAAGDPFLALWLATGELLTPTPPTELSGAPPEVLTSLATAPRTARFAAVQRVMKRRTNRNALLGLPWPAALGTPPWTAARVLRYLEVDFVPVMLDDGDRDGLAAALDRVSGAIGAGVPVPLYTGGDTSQGWSAALPRHVVLATARTADGFELWEPASGRVEPVTRRELAEGGRPLRALGGWSHVVWALLPDLQLEP